MFHTARTVCRPVKPPKLTAWETVAPGCLPPSLNSAILVLPMKYCQVLVACRAVNVQLNVVALPTAVAGQFRLLSSRTANRALPPLQSFDPLGASTLCGSYWRSPQLATTPRAQSACLLGGDEM